MLKTNKNFEIHLLALLWSPNYLLTKIASTEVGPFWLSSSRFLLSSILLTLTLMLSKKTFKVFSLPWKHFIIVALFSNIIPIVALCYAAPYLDTVLTSLIQGGTPLFILILSHFFLQDEKLTKTKFLGISIGIIGLGIVLSPQMSEVSLSQSKVFGILLTFFSALSFSAGIIYARIFVAQQNSALSSATATYLGAGLLGGLMAYFLEEPPSLSQVSTEVYLSIIFYAIFCSALSSILYFRMSSFYNTSSISLSMLILPVYSCLLGIFFYNENMTLMTLLGALLILYGSWKVEKKKL